MKIVVGISNRHVHLTKEVKDKIFGEDFNLEVKRYLSQKGEFASNSKVALKTDKGLIENVRVVGPLRGYTQVEILRSDEEVLGIKTEERNSGEVNNVPGLTIIGPNGEEYVESCVIIQNRHIHMTEEEAKEFNVSNDEIVKIKKDNTIIDNVHIKVRNDFVLECHLDRDDELKYDIHTGDLIEIIK